MTDKTSQNPMLDAIGYQFQPTRFTYDERDVALYALSVGAAADPLDPSELQFVYELNPEGFRCLPTFAVTFPLQALEQIGSIPGLKLNLLEVLHGEHYLEVLRPLPISATVTNHAHISAIYDKGSGALIVVEITSTDEQGEPLALNRAGLFVRGRGSFGGERGPSTAAAEAPLSAPDIISEQPTDANQALLYRLSSGDRNPLHADIRFAAMLGLEQPILHGLCTYGFAARAVLKAFAGNDPAHLKSISARFTQHVYPGETIRTEMWQMAGNEIRFRCHAVERDSLVLAQGIALLSAPLEADLGQTAVPRSRAIFAEIDQRIAAHPEWLQEVGAIFQFEINGADGGNYIVDLQNAPGSARPGSAADAGCQMTMDYEDFRAMLKGELKPEMAFLTGKLQVSGNLMLAMKLGPLFAQR